LKVNSPNLSGDNWFSSISDRKTGKTGTPCVKFLISAHSNLEMSKKIQMIQILKIVNNMEKQDTLQGRCLAYFLHFPQYASLTEKVLKKKLNVKTTRKKENKSLKKIYFV
jgi:hypothetical protein